MKCLNSLMLVGAAMSVMAAVFWGSAEMPFLLMKCPRNACDLPLAELALVSIEGHSSLLDLFQCSVESLVVPLLVLSKNQDVVDETKDSAEPIEYGAHPFLEMFRCTGDSKW